jgi:serine O-acetyltransferase
MSMETELSESDLAQYTAAQINALFPDRAAVQEADLRVAMSPTLARLETIHRCIDGRFYRRNGRTYFDHLHCDQYSSYLYLLSWYLSQQGGEREQRIATKLFGLNKALHAIDLYFEVELPEIFLLAHAVGSVLGKAKYGNRFVATQNCTVGGIKDVYPTLGEGVVLCSNASILGASVIGNSVTIGAGALLINAHIPDHQTVVGRAKDIKVFSSPAEEWRTYFNAE